MRLQGATPSRTVRSRFREYGSLLLHVLSSHIETSGMVSTLRLTVAGSISTPLPVGEVSPHQLLPFPWTAELSRPSPAPYTRVHLSHGGKLLYPLRTNLGYYGSSVALQVRPTARPAPA